MKHKEEEEKYSSALWCGAFIFDSSEVGFSFSNLFWPLGELRNLKQQQLNSTKSYNKAASLLVLKWHAATCAWLGERNVHINLFNLFRSPGVRRRESLYLRFSPHRPPWHPRFHPLKKKKSSSPYFPPEPSRCSIPPLLTFTIPPISSLKSVLPRFYRLLPTMFTASLLPLCFPSYRFTLPVFPAPLWRPWGGVVIVKTSSAAIKQPIIHCCILIMLLALPMDPADKAMHTEHPQFQ